MFQSWVTIHLITVIMSRNEIVTESDLVSAVEETLKRRGILDKLKAKIRAEVFHALDDKDVAPVRTNHDPPQDLFIAMELVKDFLMLMKLDNTLSVFCEEMGQTMNMTVDRSFIGSELGVNSAGSDESVPMLVLLTQFMKKNREELVKNYQLQQQLMRDEEVRQRLILQQGLQPKQQQPQVTQIRSTPQQSPKQSPNNVQDRSDISTTVSSMTSHQQIEHTIPSSTTQRQPIQHNSRGSSTNNSRSEDEIGVPQPVNRVPSRTEAVRDSLVVEPEYSYSFYNDDM